MSLVVKKEREWLDLEHQSHQTNTTVMPKNQLSKKHPAMVLELLKEHKVPQRLDKPQALALTD